MIRLSERGREERNPGENVAETLRGETGAGRGIPKSREPVKLEEL